MIKIAGSKRIYDIEKAHGISIKNLLYKWHWDENLKHKEIADRINVPRPTVTRWFHQFNIPTQPGKRFTNLNLLNIGPRKTPPAKPKIRKDHPWKFDDRFFNEWSREMAYVLGFLLADGYVFKNRRGSCYVGFCSTDKEVIDKIRLALKSNHAIGIRNRSAANLKWKPLYVLQIGSKIVVARLKQFGIVQNKSLKVRLPNGIPSDFLGDLVRGYFDGDGCVHFKKYFNKSRNREQWSFSTRFISGSKNFLLDLQKRLKKFTHGGFIVKKSGGYELVFSRRDSFILYDLMYRQAGSLFLFRKYNIFRNALAILKGP